ncbi:MAG: hypothetical protein ACKVPX_00190 [Myxococcaceae bacterium]
MRQVLNLLDRLAEQLQSTDEVGLSVQRQLRVPSALLTDARR